MLYTIKSMRRMAEMLIKHEAKPSALFRVKQEQGNAFTILKNFQRNALIKTCLLVQMVQVYSYSWVIIMRELTRLGVETC